MRKGCWKGKHERTITAKCLRMKNYNREGIPLWKFTKSMLPSRIFISAGTVGEI